jgi:toxin YoeB
MKSLVFEGKTWEIYEALRQKDKEQHKQLCRILKEMMRSDPRVGIGRPEPLKHNLTNYWSRHLSKKDRIIYRFNDEAIFIFAIGGHYDE